MNVRKHPSTTHSPSILRSAVATSTIGLALILGTGCGTKGVPSYPVKGTVTLEGKPLEGATVMFVPTVGPPNSGVTDASGSFSIGKPGVPAGSCGVAITKTAGGPAMTNPTPEDLQKIAQAPAAKQPPKSLVPEKFGRSDTSGLTATVTSDAAQNVFTFDLAP